MRIAVFHNQPSGGARRSLLTWCRELSQRHETHIFTLTSADNVMLRDESVVGRVVRLPFQPRPPIRFGLYLNDIIRRRNLEALERVNRRAAEQIDAEGYDAVWVDTDRYTFAPYVLKYLQTPSVYYVHHRPRGFRERFAPPPASPYERARALWHRPLAERFEQHLWHEEVMLTRRARRVVTNSVFTAGRLREIYGVTAGLVPPGVDLPDAWGVGGGGYLLSVGELEVRKGHDFVLDALALVEPALRPPLQLVANGGNPAVRRQLESQAARLGIDLRIRILPPQAEISRAYLHAELFVYGAREEALGLAPLEAMAHGLPVVGVCDGGVPETVRDGRTGYLTTRDPAKFAQRVTELLTTPSVRRRMAAAARADMAGSWTWEKRAPALEVELQRVAGGVRPISVGATA
jgi:glycosyltransferase involved in cell wall biosynthesis